MESRSDDRLFTPKLLQCLIAVSGFPGNVDDNVEGNDANTYRVVGGTRMLPFPTVNRDGKGGPSRMQPSFGNDFS